MFSVINLQKKDQCYQVMESGVVWCENVVNHMQSVKEISELRLGSSPSVPYNFSSLLKGCKILFITNNEKLNNKEWIVPSLENWGLHIVQLGTSPCSSKTQRREMTWLAYIKLEIISLSLSWHCVTSSGLSCAWQRRLVKWDRLSNADQVRFSPHRSLCWISEIVEGQWT